MDNNKIWSVNNEKDVFSCNITKVIAKECSLNSKNISHTFYTLEMKDWVNVFAVTKDKTVVMVRQHRLGKNLVTLEVPAGMIEDNEDPKDAVMRELAEETGYVTDNIILLKSINVNPAIQNNVCHFFLATNCEKITQTNFDDTEEIETELIPLDEIFKTPDNGNELIQNSVALLSILLAKNYLSEHGDLK